MYMKYDKPPDGGWGWVVTFTTFLAYAIVWGVPRSYSVLFKDFQDSFLSTNAETSWIISLIVGCLACGTLIGSVVTSMVGARKTMMLGGVISCAGTIITSQSKDLATAYIGSIISGTGFGFAYCSASSQIGLYFDKRRSLAFGIASLGSPANGMLLPLLLVYLRNEYAWQGAILISAGVCLHLAVGGALLRPIILYNDRAEVCANCDNGSNSSENSLKLVSNSNKHLSLQTSKQDCTGSTNDGDGLDCLRFPNVDEMSFLQAISKATSDGQLHRANITLSPIKHASLSLPHLHFKQNSLLTNSRKSALHRNVNSRSGKRKRSNSFDNIPVVKTYKSKILQNQEVEKMMLNKTTFEKKFDKQNNSSETNASDIIWDITTFASMALPYKSLLCQWRFMLFALAGFLDFFVRLIPTSFIVVHAQAIGIDQESGALLLVIFSICDSIIRPVSGYFTSKISQTKLRKGIEIFAFGSAQACMCVLNLFAPYANHYVALSTYMGMYGITNGLNSAWCFPILTRLVPIEHLHHAIGIFHFFSGIGLLAGPPLAGYLADLVGNYSPVFYFTGVIMFFSCVTAWTLYGLVQRYGVRVINPTVQRSNSKEKLTSIKDNRSLQQPSMETSI